MKAEQRELQQELGKILWLSYLKKRCAGSIDFVGASAAAGCSLWRGWGGFFWPHQILPPPPTIFLAMYLISDLRR